MIRIVNEFRNAKLRQKAAKMRRGRFLADRRSKARIGNCIVPAQTNRVLPQGGVNEQCQYLPISPSTRPC
jgi:hypothetical protein